MDYLIYEHTIGTPAHIDTEMEELEELFTDLHYTADEAKAFITEWIPDTDRYGNKRRIYVYKLKERRG